VELDFGRSNDDAEPRVLSDLWSGRKSKSQKTSKAVKPWKSSSQWGKQFEWVHHSHDNWPALPRLRFRLTLLAMDAVANSADEMTNSPEIKPIKPVTNIAPVKISL